MEREGEDVGKLGAQGLEDRGLSNGVECRTFRTTLHCALLEVEGVGESRAVIGEGDIVRSRVPPVDERVKGWEPRGCTKNLIARASVKGILDVHTKHNEVRVSA